MLDNVCMTDELQHSGWDDAWKRMLRPMKHKLNDKKCANQFFAVAWWRIYFVNLGVRLGSNVTHQSRNRRKWRPSGNTVVFSFFETLHVCLITTSSKAWLDTVWIIQVWKTCHQSQDCPLRWRKGNDRRCCCEARRLWKTPLKGEFKLCAQDHQTSTCSMTMSNGCQEVQILSIDNIVP